MVYDQLHVICSTNNEMMIMKLKIHRQWLSVSSLVKEWNTTNISLRQITLYTLYYTHCFGILPFPFNIFWTTKTCQVTS